MRAQHGAGQPRQRDDENEFGQRQDLADDAVAAMTSAAPSVTKLPVTCAVNRPARPRKPAVSTKPPLNDSNAATTLDRVICFILFSKLRQSS